MIDCEPHQRDIKNALERLFSSEFIQQLITVENPHGSGDVARQIVDQLMVYPLDKILKKSFFDLPIDSNSA